MNWIQLVGSLEMGLLYSFVALGVYLSFRLLQFPDMTVDGTFPLGAFITAALITSKINPALSTLISFIAGGCVGALTAWLSTHLRVMNLLAGILMMTALYSVNLRIMGKPSVSLFGELRIFDHAYHPIVILLGLFIVVIGGLLCVFKTDLGFAIRAAGSNPKMARAQGINDKTMIILGVSLSNALVALAGSLYAQVYGFADITMGTGTIIVGLASVILAESIFSHVRSLAGIFLACSFGAVLYWFVMALALNMGGLGLQASDRNLVSAVLVVLALWVPALKKKGRL